MEHLKHETDFSRHDRSLKLLMNLCDHLLESSNLQRIAANGTAKILSIFPNGNITNDTDLFPCITPVLNRLDAGG